MSSELASGPARPRLGEPPSGAPVRTADVYTAREVLRLRMSVGQMAEEDPGAEYYWAELLKDCSEDDVFEAAWDHYRIRSRPLWPADILEWVRNEAKRRIESITLRREVELAKRTARGWETPTLARWTPVFDLEIARGSGPDEAAQIADSMVESSASKPVRDREVNPDLSRQPMGSR